MRVYAGPHGGLTKQSRRSIEALELEPAAHTGQDVVEHVSQMSTEHAGPWLLTA